MLCKLQNDILLSSKKFPENVVSTSATSNRGKHIVIYNVWFKLQFQTMNNNMSNMLFEISYVDKQGEIENLRRTICGQQFESMIHVMKYCSR